MRGVSKGGIIPDVGQIGSKEGEKNSLVKLWGNDSEVKVGPVVDTTTAEKQKKLEIKGWETYSGVHILADKVTMKIIRVK